MAPPSPQFSAHPENEILCSSPPPLLTISNQFPSASSPRFRDSSLKDIPTASRISSDNVSAPDMDNSLVQLPRMRPPPVTAEETPVRPSTSESNDEDGFSIITPDQYSGYVDDGSGYTIRSLMDIVEDSFRPSLDGHRYSPEASEFEANHQDDEDDEALLSSPILSQISDLTSTDLAASFFITPIDGDDEPPIPRTHPLKDEFWKDFRRSAQLVPVLNYAPQDNIEEGSCEGFRSNSVLKPAFQRSPPPEIVEDEYGEASTITQTTVLGTKEDAASAFAIDGSGEHKSRASTVEYASESESESGSSSKAHSEFEDQSIQETQNTDNATQSKETQPLPPHLRVKPGQPSARPTSESGESGVSSKSIESASEIDREASIRDLIDSIYIDEIALLATVLYSVYAKIPEHRVDCSVDPNPRIGSKNLLYTVKLSGNARFGEVIPAKWLVRIPLSARNFSAIDRYWLESDIKAMTFIKEKTDIPVPYIYSYDLYEDNCLGVPFVFMDCMKGGKVDDLWGAWNDEEKMRCLSQCAEHMLKLRKFPFDRIGVIAVDYVQERLVINGKPHQLNGGGAVITGPFTSSKSYLEDIWVRSIKQVRGSTETEEVKAKNLLVLLKLLTGALVEPVTEMFYLSPPELGGGNVLVDFEGNITGFVGWEEIGILPKGMGYARYPEWITEDWIPSMKKKPISGESLNNSRRFRPVETSSANGNAPHFISRGNLDRLRNFVYLEYQDPPAYFSGEQTYSSEEVGDGAADPRDESTTKSTDDKAIPNLVGGVSDPSEASGPSGETTPNNTSVEYNGASLEYEKWKYRKTENGGNRRYEGMGYRKRGYTTRQHNHNRQSFDEATELEKATTSEEKAKVHTVSKWNSLSGQLENEEAHQRADRNKKWHSKEESEKKEAIEQASVMPPMVETFKKVIVGPDQTRKLVEVTKTYRGEQAVTFSDEMARYRAMYDDFVLELSPEDLQATKSSLISTALYVALKNDSIRPHIVPKLAKEVFGNSVGPNILTMVGNSPWAQRLLAKPDDHSFASGNPEPDDTKPQAGMTIRISYIKLAATLIIVAIFSLASWVFGLKNLNPDKHTELEKFLLFTLGLSLMMIASLFLTLFCWLFSEELERDYEEEEEEEE
ncbi:hypothetical protein P167DRAFT_573023 [Morchella conica CCBAS932]|uniref:Aminoglycoside phosphotransferase domain-containing protein n=1 Tax=Morchella conica CCBAS932 TaxID=1392247 RepID=A0A3N4L6U5_9PEZI|nr:hypothetical protein P167DRAFT_573023 [Morchella conica CCBAS932]